MKGSRIAVLAGGAALALGSMLPAQAAGPYTIATSGTFVTGVRQAFANSGCNAALVNSPADGTDAKIVDAGGWAGTFRNVSWAPVAPVGSPIGRLTVFFYSGGCQQLLDPNTDGTILGNNKTFFVPPGTRWMVVENFFNGPVNFFVN